MTFIQKLKDEQRAVHRIIASASNGDAPPVRKHKFRKLQERIDRLKADYVTGRRDLQNYWKALAHVVHSYN